MVLSAASIVNQLLKQNRNPRPKATTAKAVVNSILTHLKNRRLQKAVSVLFAFPESLPYDLYAHLFQICASYRAIIEARKVESHLVTFSPTPPIFLLNRAIEAYGKCGHLNDARELFEEMPQRDGGSWNAMITAYSQQGYPDEALSLFQCMHRSGINANAITFASILSSCAAAFELHLSRQIHGLITKCGICGNLVLGTSLVNVYGKCQVMRDARKIFHEIRYPSAITWNMIVRQYLDIGDAKEAISMFSKMLSATIKPLNFAFSNALVACSRISALKEGMQIHGVIIKLGFQADNIVSCSLINVYVKCGRLDNAHSVFDQLDSKDIVSWTSIMSGYALSGKTWEARKLFDEMPERNVISWNAMLAGYTHCLQWLEAVSFVYLMLDTTTAVDYVTLSLILNVSAGLSDDQMGKQVHGYMYRHGLHCNLMVGNALLNMYGKCGNLKSARVWFIQMSNWRDMVSWNALFTIYARHHFSEQAITIFSEMPWLTKPTVYTFGTLLAACANTFALYHGKQIHGFIIRHGYEIDLVIRSVLIDMYSKCRCLRYAFEVFRETSSRDVILWNTIILGFYHNHKAREALELFKMMLEEDIKPDHVTFQGILLACIEEGLVNFGSHCFTSMSEECGVLPRLEHYDCMIELYSQHGCMDELENFMKTMPIEPTISMLKKALYACKKHGYLRFGEWIMKQIYEFRY